MKIGGDSLDEVINNLKAFRRYKPYQYSGKFYIAYLNDQGYAFRSVQSLKNKAGKLNIDTFDCVVLGQ